MAEDEVRLPSIPSIEQHPIKVLLVAVLATIAGAWVIIRPAIVDDLSLDFVTSVSAEQHHDEIKDEVMSAQKIMGIRIDGLEDKIDTNSDTVKSLQTEVRLTAAFQLERSLKMDLESHRNQPESARGDSYSNDVARLERQLGLATDYKTCLLENKPNCDYLQRQLWQ